jgi:hypothetical protein
MSAKPTTIDEYLAPLGDKERQSLDKLRRAIQEAAPEAEECISYGVPAFRLDGMLVGFGASAKHCSFFLMNRFHGGRPQNAAERLRHQQGNDPLSSGQTAAEGAGQQAGESPRQGKHGAAEAEIDPQSKSTASNRGAASRQH